MQGSKDCTKGDIGATDVCQVIQIRSPESTEKGLRLCGKLAVATDLGVWLIMSV
jgi:hypothetical protein